MSRSDLFFLFQSIARVKHRQKKEGKEQERKKSEKDRELNDNKWRKSFESFLPNSMFFSWSLQADGMSFSIHKFKDWKKNGMKTSEYHSTVDKSGNGVKHILSSL